MKIHVNLLSVFLDVIIKLFVVDIMWLHISEAWIFPFISQSMAAFTQMYQWMQASCAVRLPCFGKREKHLCRHSEAVMSGIYFT
jgi:hypothetical protein